MRVAATLAPAYTPSCVTGGVVHECECDDRIGLEYVGRAGLVPTV